MSQEEKILREAYGSNYDSLNQTSTKQRFLPGVIGYSNLSRLNSAEARYQSNFKAMNKTEYSPMKMSPTNNVHLKRQEVKNQRMEEIIKNKEFNLQLHHKAMMQRLQKQNKLNKERQQHAKERKKEEQNRWNSKKDTW